MTKCADSMAVQRHLLGLRRDVRNLFREFARRSGAELRDGHRVVSVDVSKPSIVLEDGSEIQADLVIGADGNLLHSCLLHSSRVLILDRFIFKSATIAIPRFPGNSPARLLFPSRCSTVIHAITPGDKSFAER